MSGRIPEDDYDDEPQSHADRLFGFLRGWGLAEFMLDMCIVSIFHHHNGQAIQPQFPMTLERKLAFFIAAHEQLPALSPFIDYAREIDALFTREKNLRNTIVHGSPLQYREDGTVVFMQVKKRRKGLPEYGVRTVRPADWDRLFNTGAELFALLLIQVVGIVPGFADSALDQSDKPRRDGWVEFSASLPVSKRVSDLLNEILASRRR